MSNKKIIAVVGGTGAQGGGLVNAILNESGGFTARVLTRNPGSDKGKALAQRGAEAVKADIDNVNDLTKAFAGAHGAFCVTNFWEHFSPEKEQQQARNMAQAAKEMGVKHVVWSTLDDTRKKVPLSDDRMPTLMDNYKVPHFDAKGEANAYFKELGVPTTYLHTSFYWDNLVHFGMQPKRGEDGRLKFYLPMGDKKLPGIAAEDIGPCAFGVFKRGSEFVGKPVGIAGEHLSGKEMADAMTQAFNQPVDYVPVPPDDYRKFDFPGAQDLGNMFQYKQEFEEEYRQSRDVKRSKSLHPGLMSFAQWLDKYKSQIPIE